MKTERYESPYGRHITPGGNPGPRVNMRGAVQFLNRMRPFDTAHCYARWLPTADTRSTMERTVMEIRGEKYRQLQLYVVFSCADGFNHGSPLYVYDSDASQWFECIDMLYGKITTRTRKRFRHLVGKTLKMDTHNMAMLMAFGYRHMAQIRLNRGRP